ncbi:hypothetical protein EXIGLDRAFT_736168 [Exidia glandulosa HHB12029]|uniref:Uncharacterized protein n=1 Tax=Exidia glandulosa HHB12029 TaxID=1314781 RepID=A0A166AT76_EXIGL|nr:hypothetical protein EXIGLDRAFT_736168 [Exidia glandulosa HHB12029]
MSHVVDFPQSAAFPCPYGAFVVVELDPLASTGALNDGYVTLQASQLHTQKYLAVVHRPLVIRPQLRLTLHLVGQGLPQPEWASIPIHSFMPEQQSHTRQAVRASGPLPVENAYVHTGLSLDCTVSQLFESCAVEVRLSDEDMTNLITTNSHDKRMLEDRGHECNSDTDSSWSGSEEDSVADSLEVPEAIHAVSEPFFRVWRDLSVLDSTRPGQPDELHRELAELESIRWEWYHRTYAVADPIARLDEWRMGVDSKTPRSVRAALTSPTTHASLSTLASDWTSVSRSRPLDTDLSRTASPTRPPGRTRILKEIHRILWIPIKFIRRRLL